MSPFKKHGDGVLRGVSTHAQPRHLPRPPRHPGHDAVAMERSPGADVVYQRGLEEGRAAGLREGLQDAQQRIDEATRLARQEFEDVASQRLQEFKTEAATRLAQLERLTAAFEMATMRRLAELEADAIALAYGAVCKLLGEQLSDATAITAIVQQGLAQLRGSVLLAVRMNDADLRVLLGDEQGHRLQASIPQVKWVADPAVTLGGCLIDTTAGSLDARLETQLSALRALWLAPPDQPVPSV